MKTLIVLLFAGLTLMMLLVEPIHKVHCTEATVSSSSFPILEAAAKNGTIIGKTNLTNQPLYFIPNAGQVAEKAKFYARTSRYTLWLTQEALIFDSMKGSSKDNKNNESPSGEGCGTREVTRLTFPGSTPNPVLLALQATKHRVNYLHGNNPSAWKTDIPTTTAVLYQGIYPGIHLKVYGLEKQVEYDWMVSAGADPTQIRLLFKGSKRTALDKKGDLTVLTELGEFKHHKPLAYQIEKGEKVPVKVTYVKVGENEYGFEVGHYNKKCQLVIDPVVAIFSTLIGGSALDQPVSIALDIHGNAYITGITGSGDFPIVDGYQETHNGATYDAFVSKFSASGNELLYSTYIGGSGDDEGECIKVSSIGKAYITGSTTSTDFPTKAAFQNSHAGGSNDIFVAIIAETGSSLVYSTYLGGSGNDRSYGLALDINLNIYITGDTSSTNFPLQNPYKNTYRGGDYDAFVTKINSNGGNLEYSTYLGGSGNETGYDLAVLNNSAYIIGRTSSTNFPLLNAYQNLYGGGVYDAFVTKLSTSGSSLIYSTYLGGSLSDSGYGIAVDSSGKAYTVGDTSSTNFPLSYAYQHTYGGGSRDAFLATFAANGLSLEQSTYFGGSEGDASAHVVVAASDYICFTGTTSSANFPISRAYQSSFMGGSDAFVAVYNKDDLNLSFATFLGGANNDYGRGIALDSSRNIYVTGDTKSADFPTYFPYQDTHMGNLDGYVIKFSSSELGTLCGAVDNCNLTWTTGGSGDWFEQTQYYHYDNDAARSGICSNGQSSYIQTKVNGPAELSFWWRLAANYEDSLTWYIDGVAQNTIDGSHSTGTWTQITATIPTGAHTLKWNLQRGIHTPDYGGGYLDKVEYSSTLPIVINRDHLTFGAVLGTATASQTFAITNNISPTSVSWTALSDQAWLTCSPNAGTNDHVVSVSVNTTGLMVGTYTGTITLTTTGAGTAKKTVDVTLNIFQPGGSGVPFGTYDTPSDNASITSSVPFTGWVLDDIGVESVKLYRQESGTLYYIGEATFVEGARPDVEQAYPYYPGNYTAGWGYMMLTNFLPYGGNGTYHIAAIATDKEGHQVTLGTKTLFIDNAHAVKPFGAIDTPTAGGTASGSAFINFGWVLTPQPNSIAVNGSTIDVWIDGANLGHPVYNQFRQDIATVFPGYFNSNGAVGYYSINTTGYANGVHTIQWTAKDSAGNTDGIGSRYFMIQNGSARSTKQSNPNCSRKSQLPSLHQLTYNTLSPVQIQRGFHTESETGTFNSFYPDRQGVIKINIKELERVMFRFGQGGLWSGGLVQGKRLMPLPIGSSLDNTRGTFTWQPGPGYLGEFRLVFAKPNSLGKWMAQTVVVTITPKF